MTTYLLVGLASGTLFMVLDALLNANPIARRLSAAYAPIARDRLNLVPAVAIDLLLGLVMAGIFILLRGSFPGGPVVGAAICFGLLAWFFRVLMNALSQWLMFNVPVTTHLYVIATGLLEMLALGFFYAVAFRSFP